MPVAFRHRGYRFVFYSNEGDPREPPHIHALKDGLDAKFWLVPDVELAYNGGYSAKALRELHALLTHRRNVLLEAWNGYFFEGD
jgi:hypothetical protein